MTTFTFTALTAQQRNQVIESNYITVTGVSAAQNVAISITGGEYCYNSGTGWTAWTAAAGNVQLDYIVKVRGTSSASYNTGTNVVLTIGGVQGTFTITTINTPSLTPANIVLSSTLLQNGGSPKYASNFADGSRTLYPLKFTPDVIYNGQELIDSEAFAGTNSICRKTIKVAEGLSAYEFNIMKGVTYAWGASHQYLGAPKAKGSVVNVQVSVFFPSDFDWAASGGGRLKFMRLHTANTEFKYMHVNNATGNLPALGTTISQGAASGTFAGAVAALDTVATSIASGQPFPADCYIRLTNVSGSFTNGPLTGGVSATVTAAPTDNEGYNDIYIWNTAAAGTSAKDGRLLHIIESFGSANTGSWTESAVNLQKGVWETLEMRVVFDDVPITLGGTARTQLWRRVGTTMVPIIDIQNQPTLHKATSVNDGFLLFSYWNGGSPKTQSMYMDRMVVHFNPNTLVETDANGIKIIGGVAP